MKFEFYGERSRVTYSSEMGLFSLEQIRLEEVSAQSITLFFPLVSHTFPFSLASGSY